MKGKKVAVKLVRSPIGYDQRQRATLRGLGLLRLQQRVELVDGPGVRGMIEKVKHLVEVEG
jgi:large subunit ribosomal protein L30